MHTSAHRKMHPSASMATAPVPRRRGLRAMRRALSQRRRRQVTTPSADAQRQRAGMHPTMFAGTGAPLLRVAAAALNATAARQGESTARERAPAQERNANSDSVHTLLKNMLAGLKQKRRAARSARSPSRSVRQESQKRARAARMKHTFESSKPDSASVQRGYRTGSAERSTAQNISGASVRERAQGPGGDAGHCVPVPCTPRMSAGKRGKNACDFSVS
jgi:hypothetical protein